MNLNSFENLSSQLKLTDVINNLVPYGCNYKLNFLIMRIYWRNVNIRLEIKKDKMIKKYMKN